MVVTLLLFFHSCHSHELLHAGSSVSALWLGQDLRGGYARYVTVIWPPLHINRSPSKDYVVSLTAIYLINWQVCHCHYYNASGYLMLQGQNLQFCVHRACWRPSSFVLDSLVFVLTMRSLRKYSTEFQYLYPSGLLHILVRDGEYTLIHLKSFICNWP